MTGAEEVDPVDEVEATDPAPEGAEARLAQWRIGPDEPPLTRARRAVYGH